MKNLLVAGMMVVCIWGCDTKDPAVSQTDMGASVFKAQDESAVIRDSGDLVSAFEVLVKKIEDSRCPSDAICVHMGWASVDFKIRDNEFTLQIGQTKEFSLFSRQFKLTLLNVTPYPTSANHDERKIAVFKVERL